MVNDSNPLVYGGVFGIVFGATLALSVFLDAGESEAEQVHTQTTQSPLVYLEPDPISFEDLDAPVIVMDEVRIVSHLATKVEKDKEWVCGEVKENLVGGRNSNCEWK